MCKSYVTKEKNSKSVKGLQRNFKKCILKNSQLFANISKLRPKQKKMQIVKVGSLSPLKVFTPCIIFNLKKKLSLKLKFFSLFTVFVTIQKLLRNPKIQRAPATTP